MRSHALADARLALPIEDVKVAMVTSTISSSPRNEEAAPDISLLSPDQQDRYQELADKLLADEISIASAEIGELNQFAEGRTMFGGPNLEIPDSLVFHFK
jgi:hypothetical protein